MTKYQSTTDAFDELHEALNEVRREVGKEATRKGGLLDALNAVGVDGKFSGGDVIISLGALALGLACSVAWGVVKLSEGYRPRDAVGCGADVMTLFVGFVVLRALLDLMSVPVILDALFDIESVVRDKEGEPVVVREPVFVNRKIKRDVHVGLPNGELLERGLIFDFVDEVKGADSKAWSREHWCNPPTHKKRPGKGVMSQEQWAGIKELLDEAGVWRSEDATALDDFKGAMQS